MGTYGHVAFTSVGVPMRRAAKDIHPRDYAAFVPEAKKDGTWGSVVQLLGLIPHPPSPKKGQIPNES